MKMSQLKILALILWGTIVILGGSLLFLAVNSRAGAIFESQQTAPSAGSPPFSATPPVPSATPTPLRGILLFPSATHRPITITPIPSNTPVTPLPIARFFAAQDGGPLTGQTAADPNLFNRRPVAVKISSFPRSLRPYQAGLTHADVAFEYYIEDGLTRFIAVFYGQDASRAGPVRSGRYFDEHIMRMFHASLVFANADERVETHLLESDLKPLLFVPRPDNCPPLCRDTSIEGYNNVFVNTAGVGPKLTDNSKQDLRATFFGPLYTLMTLPQVELIYTHYSIYSYGYWQYDPSEVLYWRFSDAQDASSPGVGEVYQPHIDHLNERQISAANVIVLVVPHNFNNEFDRADQVFNIDLNGSGPAYVFREGRMVKALWLRDKIDQPIKIVDEHNNAVPLQPGETFYQVINPESEIVQNGQQMDFYFYIPPRVVTLTPTPFGFDPTPTPKKKK